MTVPPKSPGKRRCGGHGAPAIHGQCSPCPALLLSSHGRRHQLQAFILRTGKALPSLLRAAHDPSHDHRNPPSQLLSLPQFPQRLMLWDKGNCSSPLAVLPHLHEVALKCLPKPRLQEQLRCTETKGAGAGQDGVTSLRGAPPWTPSAAVAAAAHSHQSLCKPQQSRIFTTRKQFHTSPFRRHAQNGEIYRTGRK